MAPSPGPSPQLGPHFLLDNLPSYLDPTFMAFMVIRRIFLVLNLEGPQGQTPLDFLLISYKTVSK